MPKEDVGHENQRETNDTALWAMQATPKARTEGIKMKRSHKSLCMKYNSQDTLKSKHFIYLSLSLFSR